jgi:transposase
MLFLDLTDGQRAELELVSRQAVGRVALRAQMVLLSDRGRSVPEIAAIHRCGHDVVRLWLHRYEADGVAGLADLPRSGRPPKDRLADQIVDAQASQSPRCAGLVQSCWTVALLTAFLAARFGLALSATSVRRRLKAAGWRWRRPRLAPASALPGKRDPDAPAKEAAIAAALAAARRGACRLLFLDECDLHLLPTLRACWQRGPRLRVPTPGTNAKRAFFGALEAVSGAFHVADHDRKLAAHFVAFLQRLADTYPAGPLVLAMDNVQMHRARVVQRWLAANPRVSVLWLPRYAAHDANPVERVWGLLKGAVAANRLAGSLAELVAAARRFFRTLPPHPVSPAFLQPTAPMPNFQRHA